MKIRLLLIALALLTMVMATPAQAANRALLIGIGKYKMRGIDLPGIDKDVGMMREVALTLGYKPSEIKVLLDEEATLENIQKTIDQWLVKGVGKDDHVLFYYSGHGTQIHDKDQDEVDKADEVLVSHDAALGINTLNNVFVDDMFNDMLSKIDSKNVFILIDACHSGTATRGVGGFSDITPKYLEYPGMPKATRATNIMDKSISTSGDMNYAALSAAQDNQRAQASRKGSYFTRGIKDSVDRAKRDGRAIDMVALHGDATDYIIDHMPDPSLVHSPHLVGDLSINGKDMFIPKAQPKKEKKKVKKQEKTKKKPAPGPRKTWSGEIKEIVKNAGSRLFVKTNGKTFRTNEPLEISCSFKEDGYVNVVTIMPGQANPTVLFPNEFHQDNMVKAGQTVTIPAPDDEFDLVVGPPYGKAIVAVFHSKFPSNFYRQGYGEDVFKTMSPASTRGFFVKKATAKPAAKAEPAAPSKFDIGDYAAGMVVLKLREKK